MRIYIGYDFPNWNQYINIERANKYAGASLKKKETAIVKRSTLNKKYEGKYPVKITFYKYFKDKRQDLDNVRVKGIIDGLVKSGVIKNDNLNCVAEIRIIPIFHKERKGIEILIEEV